MTDDHSTFINANRRWNMWSGPVVTPFGNWSAPLVRKSISATWARRQQRYFCSKYADGVPETFVGSGGFQNILFRFYA